MLRQIDTESFLRVVNWRYKNKGKLRGLSTGIVALDQITDGIQRGEVTIVAGRPGMGKSGVLANISYNMAKAGYNVGVFTLEMPTDGYLERMVSFVSGIPSLALRDHGYMKNNVWVPLTQADFIRYGQTAKEISSLPLRFEQESVSVRQMIEAVSASLEEGVDFDAVFIDYLQLMPDAPDYAGINQVMNKLGQMAKKFKVAVILACQLNRDVEKREVKRPTLPDLSGSGQIEAGGYCICFLYRQDYYDKMVTPDAAVTGKLEINIAKNRNGPTGAITCFYDVTRQLVTDWAEPPAAGEELVEMSWDLEEVPPPTSSAFSPTLPIQKEKNETNLGEEF